MTVTIKSIIPSKLAENSQTTQYTATNAKTLIDKFTVLNTSTSPVTFNLNIVPVAGSASSTNLFIKNKAIAANETYSCPEIIGHVLEVGSFISTIAGTASVLSICATGREIT